MAFRCDSCNEPQDPNTKPVKTTTETRERKYVDRDNNGNEIRTSWGEEIVQEQDLCASCAGYSNMNTEEAA